MTVATDVLDKKADLAGPGIGNYEELEKILPEDYTPCWTRRRRSARLPPSSGSSRTGCAGS